MYCLAAIRRPCRIARRLLALGAFLSLVSAGSTNAQNQSPLGKRLLTEAPRAWQRQQEFWLTLEGTNRIDRRMRSDGTWTSTPGKNSWKQCQGNMLEQFERLEAGSWKGSIRGENSEYIFILGRRNETRPWVIQEVNKKVKKSPDVWNARKTLCHDLILAPRTLPLPEVFQSQRFQCVSVTPEPTQGEELARLTFAFSPEGANRLKGGWVVLDPSHYWVIRWGEIDLDLGEQQEGTAKWTVQYDYKEGSDRHPIATRNVLKGRIWQNGRIISEQEYSVDFDLHERASIPASEFTLSAYGLPEPSWAQPKRTAWYLWLALAGILCLVLGAAVGWLRRRRAA